MSAAKITVTYKRKRGASHTRAADGVAPEPPPPVSECGVDSSEAPSHGVADTKNNVLNGHNSSTCTKQQDACKPMQQNAETETAKPRAHASEKEHKEIQSCESLPRMEGPEICCATSLPIADAGNKKLQCTNDAVNPIPPPSYVCGLRQDDGTINKAEDSNNSAPAKIIYHQAPDDTTIPSQCKNRFSPLLAFRRRVQRKNNLGESPEGSCSEDNGKRCSTLTCSPPSLLVNTTPLLKETGGNSLDTAYKLTIAGTSTGQNVLAQRLLEQKSSSMLKSREHTISQHDAEEVNQSLTSERDGTLVSEFTSMPEINNQDVRVEGLSKTLGRVTEAAEGEMKDSHDGPLESEGSTKYIPVIALDGDNDERGKLLENSMVHDQVVQEKNESAFTSGKINLNCVEVPQERLLNLNDSSVQRLPNQDHCATEQKQVTQPIERLFFTKEKDIIHAKEEHQEGTSTMRTLYSNFFDPTPSWKAGSSKGPENMPSELQFKIMDKVPESSLDLSLDSFQYSGRSAFRYDRLFHGGKSSGSHLLAEKLGTYSYRRHQAPSWSEEELDFLWIGVRRYGTNNWNAMLRDTRLRFSNSRMAEDLAMQWDKEQKKLLGGDLLQSIRTSALGPAPPPHIAEDYVGSSSCSGCSKSPFLAAQANLSMGDVYLRNSRASDRGHHHLSNLGRYNLHEIDNGSRNSSLGSFPVASSSHGRSGSRRKKTSKSHKSYYDNRSHWCQEVPDRMSRLFPMNQQPINSLPQWLTKDVKTGTSWLNPEMWPSTSQVMGHSTADPPSDSLRAAAFLFPDDTKPHVPNASLKRTLKRKGELRSLGKKLFQNGGDTLDLNQRAAAMAAGLKGATTSDTGASSEETVSDS